MPSHHPQHNKSKHHQPSRSSGHHPALRQAKGHPVGNSTHPKSHHTNSTTLFLSTFITVAVNGGVLILNQHELIMTPVLIGIALLTISACIMTNSASFKSLLHRLTPRPRKQHLTKETKRQQNEHSKTNRELEQSDDELPTPPSRPFVPTLTLPCENHTLDNNITSSEPLDQDEQNGGVVEADSEPVGQLFDDEKRSVIGADEEDQGNQSDPNNNPLTKPTTTTQPHDETGTGTEIATSRSQSVVLSSPGALFSKTQREVSGKKGGVASLAATSAPNQPNTPNTNASSLSHNPPAGNHQKNNDKNHKHGGDKGKHTDKQPTNKKSSLSPPLITSTAGLTVQSIPLIPSTGFTAQRVLFTISNALLKQRFTPGFNFFLAAIQTALHSELPHHLTTQSCFQSDAEMFKMKLLPLKGNTTTDWANWLDDDIKSLSRLIFDLLTLFITNQNQNTFFTRLLEECPKLQLYSPSQSPNNASLLPAHRGTTTHSPKTHSDNGVIAAEDKNSNASAATGPNQPSEQEKWTKINKKYNELKSNLLKSYKTRRYYTTIPIGVQNYGATCYFNAVFQQLLSSFDFLSFFIQMDLNTIIKEYNMWLSGLAKIGSLWVGLTNSVDTDLEKVKKSALSRGFISTPDSLLLSHLSAMTLSTLGVEQSTGSQLPPPTPPVAHPFANQHNPVVVPSTPNQRNPVRDNSPSSSSSSSSHIDFFPNQDEEPAVRCEQFQAPLPGTIHNSWCLGPNHATNTNPTTKHHSSTLVQTSHHITPTLRRKTVFLRPPGGLFGFFQNEGERLQWSKPMDANEFYLQLLNNIHDEINILLVPHLFPLASFTKSHHNRNENDQINRTNNTNNNNNNNTSQMHCDQPKVYAHLSPYALSPTDPNDIPIITSTLARPILNPRYHSRMPQIYTGFNVNQHKDSQGQVEDGGEGAMDAKLRVKYQYKLLSLFPMTFSASGITTYTPTDCGHSRKRLQNNQWAVTLTIPQRDSESVVGSKTQPLSTHYTHSTTSSLTSREIISSRQCFDDTFKNNRLDGLACPQCGGEKKPTTESCSHLLARAMPSYLTLYLPRFSLAQTSSGFIYKKDTRYIGVESVMSKQSDLSPYLIDSTDPSGDFPDTKNRTDQSTILDSSHPDQSTIPDSPHSVNQQNLSYTDSATTDPYGRYKLDGIVVHRGSPQSGHYVCFRTNKSILLAQTFLFYLNLFRAQSEQETMLIEHGFRDTVKSFTSSLSNSSPTIIPLLTPTPSQQQQSFDSKNHPQSSSPSSFSPNLSSLCPSHLPSYYTITQLPSIPESDIFWFYCDDINVTPIQPTNTLFQPLSQSNRSVHSYLTAVSTDNHHNLDLDNSNNNNNKAKSQSTHHLHSTHTSPKHRHADLILPHDDDFLLTPTFMTPVTFSTAQHPQGSNLALNGVPSFPQIHTHDSPYSCALCLQFLDTQICGGEQADQAEQQRKSVFATLEPPQHQPQQPHQHHHHHDNLSNHVPDQPQMMVGNSKYSSYMKIHASKKPPNNHTATTSYDDIPFLDENDDILESTSAICSVAATQDTNYHSIGPIGVDTFRRQCAIMLSYGFVPHQDQ